MSLVEYSLLLVLCVVLCYTEGKVYGIPKNKNRDFSRVTAPESYAIVHGGTSAVDTVTAWPVFSRTVQVCDRLRLISVTLDGEGAVTSCEETTSASLISRFFSTKEHALTPDWGSAVLDQVPFSYNVSVWADICRESKAQDTLQSQPSSRETDLKWLPSSSRTKRAVSLTEHSTAHRSRRSSMYPLIYPGTKWCGRGNISTNGEDLGEDRRTDRCCKTHDHCSKVIPPFTTKYNYWNIGALSISHCDCDRRFRKCLRRVTKQNASPIADYIGYMFFDYFEIPCFTFELVETCQRYTFLGRCIKYEKALTAVVKGPLQFRTPKYESKKARLSAENETPLREEERKHSHTGLKASGWHGDRKNEHTGQLPEDFVKGSKDSVPSAAPAVKEEDSESDSHWIWSYLG